MPTEHQEILCNLSEVYSKALHSNSFTYSSRRSVILVCLSIPLHKYTYNFLQVTLFSCFLLCGQYLRTSFLLYYNITVDSMASQLTQHWNSYRYVECEIFKYFFFRGYEIFDKETCLYLGFEPLYTTNHIWFLVGFDECTPEASYCLE